MPDKYDLAIIGGGPGGYVAAIRAAQLGAKVALVEEVEVGGVCLNRGCIPTKALLTSAELLSQIKRAADFGIQVTGVSLDLAKVRERKRQVVQQLVNGVKLLLKSNGVTVIQGRGKLAPAQRRGLAGPKRVAVGNDAIEAERIIVATGSSPATLPISGADGPGIWNSDQALELEEAPPRLLVIGGGAIGVEMASIYEALGSKVSVVEMMPTLVPNEDPELGRIMAKLLEARGIKVHTGTSASRIEADGGRSRAVLNNGQTIEAERVLVAVGRRPNTRDLGLKLNRGCIVAGKGQQTDIPGIYAIGDVTGGMLLAHMASAQGIVAVETALEGASSVNLAVVPRCLYTHPEMAAVGMNEEQAKAGGREIKVGRFPVVANGRALTLGQPEGLVKVVADARSEQVLGLHIIGPGASELVAEGALALAMEATLEEIVTTIHAHPTLSEAVAEASLAARGMALHIYRRRA